MGEDELALLRAAPRVGGCEAILLTDRARLGQATELIRTADAAQVGDPAFRDELRGWIRFNGRSAMARGDGLFAACSGHPSLPSWLEPAVFGMMFKPGAENDRRRRQLASSAGLAVFASERDDKAHRVQAGRSYPRFALQATALSLRHAFLNQAGEVAEFRPELAGLLDLGGRRPDLVVRFGHGPAMPYSLRRPIGDVIDGA